MNTITEYPQADFFGNKLDYAISRPQIPTNNWLVFLVGLGELSDGAGGNLKELYKYGFPRLAKLGYDFPDFNILMIQPFKSYSTLHKIILPWIKMEHNPSKVIISGISLGADECWSLMLNDRYKIINAMVSLSGRPLGGVATVPNMIAVPVYAYHGALDKTVNFNLAIKSFNAYNALHPGLITLDIKPNEEHSGWDEAMTYNGPLHKWIIAQFSK